MRPLSPNRYDKPVRIFYSAGKKHNRKDADLHMAQNNSNCSQDKNNSAAGRENTTSTDPLTLEEFMSILFDPELIKILYDAMQKNCDVEMRFEKNGKPKFYLVKKKRL